MEDVGLCSRTGKIRTMTSSQARKRNQRMLSGVEAARLQTQTDAMLSKEQQLKSRHISAERPQTCSSCARVVGESPGQNHINLNSTDFSEPRQPVRPASVSRNTPTPPLTEAHPQWNRQMQQNLLRNSTEQQRVGAHAFQLNEIDRFNVQSSDGLAQ